MMRIFTRQTLSDFWKTHPDVEEPLKAWFAEAEHATWHAPIDIKRRYPSADPIGNDRMVFNIKGNKYRLVVKIHYNTGNIFIRFIGTHSEYDRINAEII
jgi:mRNA interferase HigB